MPRSNAQSSSFGEPNPLEVLSVQSDDSDDEEVMAPPAPIVAPPPPKKQKTPKTKVR